MNDLHSNYWSGRTFGARNVYSKLHSTVHMSLHVQWLARMVPNKLKGLLGAILILASFSPTRPVIAWIRTERRKWQRATCYRCYEYLYRSVTGRALQ